MLSIQYYNTILNMTEIVQTKERTFIEFEKGFLNNITHIGKLNFIGAKPGITAHHHDDVLEICYVYRGNPVFLVKGEEYHLKGGDIFLSFPNEIHGSGKYPQDRMILYWLGIKTGNFDGNFLQFHDPVESKSFLDALNSLSTRIFKGSKKLKNYLDDVFAFYFSEHEFRKIMIQNRLTEFLVSVIEFEKKSSHKKISPLIEDSISFISVNLQEKIQLKQLAARSRLSLPRFKQRFKDETGTPPAEFILRKKIEKAAEELLEPGRDITDIAFGLEFSSSQYFATVFKRYTNYSPSEYRKKNRPGKRGL